MVAVMKPGSVIVDLAGEAGGNCEATVPGELSIYNNVKVIGSLALACPTSLDYTFILTDNRIHRFSISSSHSSIYALF
jgi:NAD/NADP transhydrogenase alpha subunit